MDGIALVTVADAGSVTDRGTNHEAEVARSDMKSL